jgi:hypothetical protein
MPVSARRHAGISPVGPTWHNDPLTLTAVPPLFLTSLFPGGLARMATPPRAAASGKPRHGAAHTTRAQVKLRRGHAGPDATRARKSPPPPWPRPRPRHRGGGTRRRAPRRGSGRRCRPRASGGRRPSGSTSWCGGRGCRRATSARWTRRCRTRPASWPGTAPSSSTWSASAPSSPRPRCWSPGRVTPPSLRSSPSSARVSPPPPPRPRRLVRSRSVSVSLACLRPKLRIRSVWLC